LISGKARRTQPARSIAQDVSPASGSPVTALFMARLVLIIALLLALFLFGDNFGRITPSALVLPALIGLVANIVLLLFTSPRQRAMQPLIALAADVTIVLVFGYASRGNPELLIVTTAGLAFFHLLGTWSGIAHAQGVIVAGAAIAARVLFVPDDEVIDGALFIVLASIGLLASGVAIALDRTVGALARRAEQLERERDRYMNDTRERASALSELTFTLSATLNYKKVLDATLEAGRLALRLPEQQTSDLIGAVYLFHIEDNQLHVVSARRYTRGDELRVLAGKQGIIGQALAEASPVIGGDADSDPELQVIVAFQYCKSTLCIPLRAGFDTFGVIVFGTSVPHAFSIDQSEILRAIGLQSTIALQNAVLYSNLLAEKERIIDADEEARNKLARDLHDGPTQGVAAIAMRLSYVQKLFGKSPKDVPEELRKLEEIAQKTTKEMRHMLFTLRPLVLETRGLSAAFNQLADKLYELYKQSVVVNISGDVEDYLDAGQQGTLFYIVEEAVNNARKHAQAKRIRISARRQDDAAIIVVEDDGVGFSVEKMQADYEKQASLGMVNMRDRAEMLDATLRVDSAPGKGTRVTIIVPIKSQEALTTSRFSEPRTKLAQAARQRVERGAMEQHLNRQGDHDPYF
jgi:signal transduction histidine kinase